MNEQQIEQNDEATPTYRHAIDLTSTYGAPIPRGDITVFRTWLRLADNWQACLVLVPSRVFVSNEKVIPCVVPLSTAHKWAEETGDFGQCLITAGHFAANLGFNPMNPKNPTRIIDIIRDLLGELISIPPRESYAPEKVIAAQMDVIDNTTGKVTEIEVEDDHGVI